MRRVEITEWCDYCAAEGEDTQSTGVIRIQDARGRTLRYDHCDDDEHADPRYSELMKYAAAELADDTPPSGSKRDHVPFALTSEPCPECGKVLPTVTGRSMHIAKMHPEAWARIRSPETAARARYARRAPAATLFGADPTACPECGMTFKPAGLATHRYRVHGYLADDPKTIAHRETRRALKARRQAEAE